MLSPTHALQPENPCVLQAPTRAPTPAPTPSLAQVMPVHILKLCKHGYFSNTNEFEHRLALDAMHHVEYS